MKPRSLFSFILISCLIANESVAQCQGAGLATCDLCTPANSITSETPILPRLVLPDGELILMGKFSEEPGSVELRIGAERLPVQLTEWSARSAKILFHDIRLPGLHHAEIVVRNCNGEIADKRGVLIFCTIQP